MALYHFHVDQIKRSAGQSAIAAAAYRAGEKLYSEYYGETNDYSRKGGVLYTEILLPPNAPPEYKDRQTLWNAVEKVEKNKKAQLAYSFDIALQNELTMEENIALARRFVQEHFVSKGMIADLAVHEPDKGNGIPNPHFHVMTTMRPLNTDGTWGNKQRREYALDENGERIRDEKGEYVFNAVHTTDWHEPETLEHWREAWCKMVNAEFERKGIATRIDHRSYEAQGIEKIPTVHEGPLVQKMEQRGVRTQKGDLNRWIKATNRLIASIKKKLKSLVEWIAALKEELVIAKEPDLADLLIRYHDMCNAGARSQKAKAGNLKKLAAAYSFLKTNQIFTVEELERQTHELSAAVDDLVAQSKANTARIKQLDNMITFAEHIRRIQPIIDEMNAIHWKGRREKFRAAHQQEIDLYYTSQRILKEKHGVKKINIPGWKKNRPLSAMRKKNGLLSINPFGKSWNRC
ncbi:MAG: MobA/MobL family protein [Clostridia bacterium]|nr:MobA/MobL family protein [Clostridia bacterium]